MRSQRGFPLIELLMVVAIMGMIILFAGLSVGRVLHDPGPDIPAPGDTYIELRERPISSLNMTELQFVVDYAVGEGSTIAASIYQNQIIITKMDELLQAEVNR